MKIHIVGTKTCLNFIDPIHFIREHSWLKNRSHTFLCTDRINIMMNIWSKQLFYFFRFFLSVHVPCYRQNSKSICIKSIRFFIFISPFPYWISFQKIPKSSVSFSHFFKLCCCISQMASSVLLKRILHKFSSANCFFHYLVLSKCVTHFWGKI